MLSFALFAATLVQPTVARPCRIVETATFLHLDSGSAELSTRAQRQLDDWTDTIARLRFPVRDIRLYGHTDRVGTGEANRRLWARAVRDYLMRRGIARERIMIEAFEEDRLSVDTHDEVSEADNRVFQLVMLPYAREYGC